MIVNIERDIDVKQLLINLDSKSQCKSVGMAGYEVLVDKQMLRDAHDVIAQFIKAKEEQSKRIKDGIEASNKKSGRKLGQVDKLTDDLRRDINYYLQDRTIKQTELMDKHHISRDTLNKYIKRVNEIEKV
jgi:hypothetical protein